MTTAPDVQELARRFNEDEAVWSRFQELRSLRRLLPRRWFLPEAAEEQFDWEQAERDCRPARAIGIPIFHP